MKLSDKKIQELKKLKEKDSTSNAIENLYEKYLCTQKFGIEVENISTLLNENICSFKELIDKFKSIKDTYNDPCLYALLENTGLFEELIQNNNLNHEDLRYLLNTIDKNYELNCLCRNTSLLKYIVDKDLFKELVDTFKSIKDKNNNSCLCYLLDNRDLFDCLIQNHRLNIEDLKYLLNTIDDEDDEVYTLCSNTSLIKKILNEFVLNKEDADRLNRLIENIKWCKKHNIHTIFKLIEYWNEDNEDLLELNEMNKKVYEFDFDKDQKLELIELLKDNEVAQNRFKAVLDNDLADTFSFEQLMQYLTKKDKKAVVNV